MRDGSDQVVGQLDRIIAGLESDIPVQAGQEWIEQEAKPEARRLVPKLTGATEQSIDGEAGPGGLTMFATTPYAADLEYGTTRMPARPYLKPAMRSKLSGLGRRLMAQIERRKK